jgi:zinc/manganese transport system permease protein
MTATVVLSLGDFFSHPFIVYALTAGTAVAVVCGMIGYFVVLRGQVFAGDALGHVAYTGALAALAAGFDLRLGVFILAIAFGLGLGVSSRRGVADDVAIGSLFSWILGLGVFFLAYYTTHASTGNPTASVTVLFGSIFGISADAAVTAVAIAAILITVMLTIARPLMFASVDPTVAAVTGVPVKFLGIVFLGLVGAAVAEASQVVGALLVLGLLAAPAGAATQLTTKPWNAFWLSTALAVAAMWGGIVLSYAIPILPPSFAIIGIATSLFLLSSLARHAHNTTRHKVGVNALIGLTHRR